MLAPESVDWGMLVAQCVGNTSTEFPPVGDFHTISALALFDFNIMKHLYFTDYKTFKDRYRDTAKRVGLALLYGGSYRVVEAKNEAEQRKLYTNFFSTLKGFKNHLNTIEAKAKKDLYATNLLGFRVWLKDINHKDFKIASAVRRRLLNLPIQSSGANALMIAMHTINKFTEYTNTNKFANDNIHKSYYNRVVTAPQALQESSEFLSAIEALPDGNIALCIESNGELVCKYDRNLAIDTDFIAKWKLNIYF